MKTNILIDFFYIYLSFFFFLHFCISKFNWYIFQTRKNPEKYWTFQEVTIKLVPKPFNIFWCAPFLLVYSLLLLIEVVVMLIIDLGFGHCKYSLCNLIKMRWIWHADEFQGNTWKLILVGKDLVFFHGRGIFSNFPNHWGFAHKINPICIM